MRRKRLTHAFAAVALVAVPLLAWLFSLSFPMTPAIPAAATFNITVTFEALLPGTANVEVKAESGSLGSFSALTLDKGVPSDNGWVERTYKASSLVGVGADRTTRVKLALSGTPQHRPFVRNLRVIVT